LTGKIDLKIVILKVGNYSDQCKNLET